MSTMLIELNNNYSKWILHKILTQEEKTSHAINDQLRQSINIIVHLIL